MENLTKSIVQQTVQPKPPQQQVVQQTVQSKFQQTAQSKSQQVVQPILSVSGKISNVFKISCVIFMFLFLVLNGWWIIDSLYHRDDASKAKIKECLMYGYESHKKYFFLIYGPYLDNVKNRIVTEGEWRSLIWFDSDVKTKYGVNILEKWEKNLPDVQTNTNILGFEFINNYKQRYNYIWPTDGEIVTSAFGWRDNPFGGKTGPLGEKFHEGIDIYVKVGTKVMAFTGGEIIEARWYSEYGQIVSIQNPEGIISRYGHLSKIFVKVGDKVINGQIIGLSGNTGLTTGPHVHFELLKDGIPINPLPFFY
jgi:murein DD-endopeptidase MepM/ murein hydrolase activator NlpD